MGLVVLGELVVGVLAGREELNVSVVRKIRKRGKAIIPVLYGISDDDVPDPLVATN